MSKQHPIPSPRQRPSVSDPAHAPGKQHITRDHGSAAIHTIDRRQQQQRLRSAPSVHSRQTERGN